MRLTAAASKSFDGKLIMLVYTDSVNFTCNLVIILEMDMCNVCGQLDMFWQRFFINLTSTRNHTSRQMEGQHTLAVGDMTCRFHLGHGRIIWAAHFSFARGAEA